MKPPSGGDLFCIVAGVIIIVLVSLVMTQTQAQGRSGRTMGFGFMLGFGLIGKGMFGWLMD